MHQDVDTDVKRMRVYIAGPMRGIKWFNFPAFDRAKIKLEAEGYKVVSPADIDREHGFDPFKLPEDYDWSKLPDGMDIRSVIRRDLLALMTCDAIYMLDGWRSSVGARAELMVAKWLGLKVIYESKGEQRVVRIGDTFVGGHTPKPIEYGPTKQSNQHSTAINFDTHPGHDTFQTGSIRDTRDGKGRYDLLSPLVNKRLALHYERGAAKYGDRNWEKGQPFMRVVDSLKRHLDQWIERRDDEDHIAASVWNASALVHFEECIKRGVLPDTLDDRPDYGRAIGGAA